MKPTSIPEHNRIAEITKPYSLSMLEGVWIIMSLPFKMLWRLLLK